MIVLLELSLLLAGVALGLWVWRRGAVSNAAAFVVCLAAGGVGVGCGYAAARGIDLAGGRSSSAVGGALAGALLAFAFVRGVLGRWLRRGEPCRLERWEARWARRRSLRIVAASSACAGGLLLVGASAFVSVNVIALRWPNFTRGGLVLELLELRASPEAGALRDPNALERVARRIGLREVLDTYDALRVILGLPADELRWLVARDPALERVMAHPALRELAGDPAFSARLPRASAGSPSALAALLDDPRLEALRGDVSLRAALADVDLLRLRARVERRRERGFPLPLRWQQRGVGVSLQTRSEPWATYRLDSLDALDPTSAALLASAAWTSPRERELELWVRPPVAGARVQAWLNGRVLPGERSPGAWRAAWRAAPGDPQRIELALDPGADPRGRLEGWIVELIPRPEPSRVCGGSSSE